MTRLGDGGGAWRVGVGSVALPVAIGTPLDGYAARVGVADRVLDELRVGAFVVERDGERLVLVAADVIGVDRGLVDAVADTAGVARSGLVICASHTHSGPAGVVARLHPAGAERRDPAMRSRFVTACAAAIRTALRSMSQSTLRVGQAEAPGIAANRNETAGDETTEEARSEIRTPRLNPVTVLAAEAGGEVRAVVVHYACHPTVLGAESLGVSADFPGAMRRALGRKLGKDVEVLFVNGAAGDLSTRLTRWDQSYGEVERLGRRLAEAAAGALRQARPLDGPLRHSLTSVPLERKPNPGPGAAAEAARLREEATRVGASDAPDAVKRQALTRAQGAELRMLLSGATGVRPTAGLSGWQLGDLGMVTVPGELFTSLGWEIVAQSPFATTLVLGYANDYVGYLADAEAEAAGTYEALASPYSPQAGRNLVAGAVEMLGGLIGGGWTLD